MFKQRRFYNPCLFLCLSCEHRIRMSNLFRVTAKGYYNFDDKYKLPAIVPPSAVAELKIMDVRPDDIFVCAFPKSGTHWMQEIVQLILHDGDAKKLNRDHRRVVMEVIERTDLAVGDVVTGTPNFKLMSDDPSPRVFTTHLRKQLLPTQIWTKRCPIIYVYRHPKDVITSWFEYNFDLMRALSSFRGEWDENQPISDLFETFYKERLNGIHEYGAWFDHVLDYDSLKDDHNILYVSYEEMKMNLKEVVERVANFIDRPLSEEIVEKVLKNAALTTMKKHFTKLEEQFTGDPNHFDFTLFIGKGMMGRWKDRFTVRQSEEFDKVYHSKMKDCFIAKVYNI